MPPDRSPALLDDCFLHDRDRLRHDEALTLLRERLSPIAATEEIALDAANGRIAAVDTVSSLDIPGHDNAAVDGYAFAHADIERCGGAFAIAGRVAAGAIDPPPLEEGQCVRIFTGAPMPQGADTVAMQEDCTAESDIVRIPPGLKPGANRRRRGEDVGAGSVIVHRGRELRPQELAALASVGIAQVSVFAPLRVALISSGNEIVRPGMTKAAEQVYDSNHFLLTGLLDSPSFVVSDLGVFADDYARIEQGLAEAANSHDVLIATGGASRGEEDHVVAALDRLGHRHLWQLAIKPGRPVCFGQIGSTPVFGLPGNPVAAFVCFLLYVRPALIRLGGGEWHEPARFSVPAGFEIGTKKPDRREFVRGWLERDDAGNLVARKFERDGSGLISGLREATGLIEIEEATTAIRKGEPVSFIPFSEFGIGGPTLR